MSSSPDAARALSGEPSASHPEADRRLGRELGLVSATAVLVGSTIGSGIFRVPSEVAGWLGRADLFVAVWVVGAAIALVGALLAGIPVFAVRARRLRGRAP